MILCYGNPSDPGKLWQSHQGHLTRDILYKERNRLKDHTIELDIDLINLSLYHLNQILERNNKSLKNFLGIPQLPLNYIPHIENDNQINSFNEPIYNKVE